MAKVSFDFNLAPKEAIEYLRNKGFKLTFDYNELMKEAHNRAFTVAKVTRADLLNDIHEALLKSMQEGTPFKEFQKNIKPTLEKKGWWGFQEITNPSTGEVKEVNIGSQRLKNIYETNMRMAYNVAREEQMDQLPLSIYRRYVSALLETTRDSHAELHGTILHKDDPFWINNSPLNGWGCKCKKQAVSQSYMKQKGWKVSKETPKDIASKDWAYDTRKGNKLSKLSKINLDNSIDILRETQKNSIYENIADAALIDMFYKKLAIKEGDMFIDKVGDPMVIDDGLFTSGNNQTKIKKRDRHLVLDELSNTITNPDEIYLEWDEKANRLVKKMFRYFKINDKPKATLAIFEYQKNKTQGVTLYLIEGKTTLENKRVSKLIYKRESD